MPALRIIHETVYDYHRPVRFGPHRLVLRPREGHDLQVERMALDIHPPGHVDWSWDVFGNSVATLEIPGESRVLRIASHVQIRRGDGTCPDERVIRGVAYPMAYDELESAVASAYLVPTYPEERDAVHHWATGASAYADPSNAIAIVSALNAAVRKEIHYLRREEKGVQSPLQSLRIGTGSCRDLATLLMEACRALGIAARFCSGYLDCAASHAGVASTHAWAEAYLAGRGWTGFDPTLGERTGAKHIAIGLSHHPRGVMPISGRFFGSSADFIGMKVSVRFESEPWTAPLEPSTSSHFGHG